MPRSYAPEVRRQVVELARTGTRVKQLVRTFGMTGATTYNWLKQDRVDRSAQAGVSTDQAIELAAAKTTHQQLEAELAVAREVNEIFLEQGLAQKASTR